MIDPGIYVITIDSLTYVLALYVDDSILVGPSGSYIDDFKRKLVSVLTFRILGPSLGFLA